MLMRRLALRRTVTLTAAGLLVLGLLGVYYVYRGDGRHSVREITMVGGKGCGYNVSRGVEGRGLCYS